jgi:hypothetical protein
MFNAALSWQPLDLRRAQAVLTQSNQISTGRYAMTAIETINKDAQPGLLDRERIISQAGFNRWLVPPAALAIHLCIGMAYGFSVF